jgi:WD40 repeat protein
MIWDSIENMILETYSGHSTNVKVLRELNNGHILSASDDSNIKIWNLKSNLSVCTLSDHKDWIRAVELMQNGSIVTGSDDGTIRVWDPVKCKLLNTINVDRYVLALKLIHNDTLLVASCKDLGLRVWNISSEALLETNITLKNENSNYNSLEFLHDKALLLAGNSVGQIELWNSSNWTLNYKLEDFGSEDIFSLEIFNKTENNELSLLSCDSKSVIRVWNLNKYELKFKLDNALNERIKVVDLINETNQIFALSFDGSVRIWNLNNTNSFEMKKISKKIDSILGAYTFIRLSSQCKY